MDSPILIDVWTVDPTRREELVELISENLGNVIAKHAGFVSAQLYESTDGGAVMVTVCMRTVKDRLDLMDSAAVHKTLRELRAIATSHARLYRLLESLGEPA